MTSFIRYFTGALFCCAQLIVSYPIGCVPALEYSFAPRLEVGDEILSSLEAGHRSEIHYEARVYRQSSGLGRLFGDRLIAEASVLYEARWDELNGLYVVVIDRLRERVFDDPLELLSFLLTLSEQRIELPDDSLQAVYLLCRAQIEPIRLVAPLTLLTFLMPRFRSTTSWTRTPFTRIEM